MLFKKKKTPVKTYDRTQKKPAVKASICTGEKVAGFIDLTSGKFEDIMFIRSGSDMQRFLEMYQITEQDIEKIW